MEKILKEKIKIFLNINNGNVNGDGYVNGDGDGYVNGNGYGDGYVNGDGDGYVNGDGYGDGYGNGNGNGYGSGYGSGYGDGDGIKQFNKNEIYKIDDINTIIIHITNNVAKGFILNNDFSLDECYIVKGNNLFAHGKTIKEANQSLQDKILNNLNTDEAIEKFREKFNNKDKYLCRDFYVWHHILTGSCKMGRDNFIKNHNVNLKSKITVNEFIKLCEDDYGKEIIKQLKEYYK